MDCSIQFENVSDKALSLGASLVGVTQVSALLRSPSHRFQPISSRVRSFTSVIVIALAHSERHPEMDWWTGQKGGTPGSRQLININRGLKKWICKEYSAEALGLPYQAAYKGIFLKDTAVLAGLGVIGKNNLLITPQFGPRVRLRALLVDQHVQCTEPLDSFSPCDGCDAPCQEACPPEAFEDGSFQSARCLLQMRKDEANKIIQRQPTVWLPAHSSVAYCRRCEWSCPVGK